MDREAEIQKLIEDTHLIDTEKGNPDAFGLNDGKLYDDLGNGGYHKKPQFDIE